MSIVLNSSGLTIEKLTGIARHNENLDLASESLERIKKCRALIER